MSCLSGACAPIACSGAGCPPGLSCSNGFCTDATCVPSCTANHTCLEQVCIPIVVDAGALPFGAACLHNYDCLSGECIAVGAPADAGRTGFACTQTCTVQSDCLAGWTCSPISGISNHECTCSYSPQTCNGRDDDCNGVIDDQPQSDLSCGLAAFCDAGACDCSADACTEQFDGGGVCCGAQCVDLLDDPSDCGSCGRFCPVCDHGNCCSMGSPNYCVDIGACVNLASDSDNCGSCGTKCPYVETCVDGGCGCPGNAYPPAPDYCASLAQCVDFSSDPNHCGNCNNTCPVLDAGYQTYQQGCVDGGCGMLGANCYIEQPGQIEGWDCGAAGMSCVPLNSACGISFCSGSCQLPGAYQSCSIDAGCASPYVCLASQGSTCQVPCRSNSDCEYAQLCGVLDDGGYCVADPCGPGTANGTSLYGPCTPLNGDAGDCLPNPLLDGGLGGMCGVVGTAGLYQGCTPQGVIGGAPQCEAGFFCDPGGTNAAIGPSPYCAPICAIYPPPGDGGFSCSGEEICTLAIGSSRGWGICRQSCADSECPDEGSCSAYQDSSGQPVQACP